ENLSAVKKLRKVPRICADNVNSCEPERIRSGARCAHPTGGDSFFLAAKPPFAAASLNADPAISRGAGHDVLLSALVNPPLDGAAARCPAFRAFPGPRALFRHPCAIGGRPLRVSAPHAPLLRARLLFLR